MVRYTTEAELARFAAEVFRTAGMTAEHAAVVADVLVWADLRGVESHGVSRLGQYMQWAQAGIMNVRPQMRAEQISASLLRLHADRAAGPLAMSEALARLVPMARGEGIAAVVVGRMTHSGALGYYTGKAAEQGLACIAFNASGALIPYHGSRVAALGTNPISIAVPGAGEPLVFDAASSVISLGKLMQARKAGKPLEPGWAIDADGAATTDAGKAAMVLPLGGAKGSGLSLMIECVTSLLSGNPIISEALEGSAEGGRHKQNALLLAIDVAKFAPLAEFRNQVDRLSAVLKALPLAPDADEIRLPGERGHRSMRERRAGGIPLTDRAVAELAELASQRSVPAVRMSG